MILDPIESDGFPELARLTLSPVAPPVSNPVQDALALLLRAAAAGKGSIRVADTRLAEADLARIHALPQFFHHAHGRLSLPRYAQYEAEVHNFFFNRLQNPPLRLADANVAHALNAILPRSELRDPAGALLFDNAQQRIAIAGLVDARAGILTGGPGTGKTTTAAALLAVLRRLNPGLGPEQVLVTAPTGKAACRIAESIRNSIPHLKSLTPEETAFLRAITARTLHRALEWGPVPPESGGPFKRNAQNPMQVRMVLVDEASMVDLHLMRALVQALPEDAALLLLGDSDQLESVEVGGILLQLVARAAPPAQELRHRIEARAGHVLEDGPLADTALESGPPLPGLVYRLKHSRRAMNAPWILRLAEIVRPSTAPSAGALHECLQRHPDTLQFLENPSDAERAAFLETHWRPWLEAVPQWNALAAANSSRSLDALQLLGRFQFLCSTNAQVARANRLGIQFLAPGFRNGPATLPHGCPILIEKNSLALGLTNGDVGIALGLPGQAIASVGLFHSPSGDPRLFPLASLPQFSPAFGLTIHKSQGSEWDTVAIELPTASVSGFLSRNLLYTAITRASRTVRILGNPEVLRILLDGEKPGPVRQNPF